MSVDVLAPEGLGPRTDLTTTRAIVGKAVAVDVDDVPDAQRLDLALLLSLVDDQMFQSPTSPCQGHRVVANAGRPWVSGIEAQMGVDWAGGR